MLAYAAILVPFFTAVVVAIVAKRESSKNTKTIGEVPPETNLFTLLSQQGGEIAELRAEVATLRLGLDECEKRERRLLKRLGLEPYDDDDAA